MIDPHWTTLMAALLVPLVAVLGSVIAYRQWRTAQNKLKLDLFDRRLRVYDAARDYLGVIMSTGKSTQENELKFLSGTRGAIWLFNQDIVTYLENEIWRPTVLLHALQVEVDGEPVGETRKKNIESQRGIKDKLIKQYRVMDEKFAPFLKLRH